MGYAMLAGVDPVVGIYTAFFPVLVYVFMGTMPHVSMGTFAVVSILASKAAVS
jgi:MFS superfamily sulfate permease-like transporter